MIEIYWENWSISPMKLVMKNGTEYNRFYIYEQLYAQMMGWC